MAPKRGGSQRVSAWAYEYPASIRTWLNTNAPVHTEGEPPSSGSAIFVNIGSMTNNRSAYMKIVSANSGKTALERAPASPRGRTAPASKDDIAGPLTRAEGPLN